MYIKKVCRVPPEIGLNIHSKTKDKKAKQLICTVKGKTLENRCKLSQQKLKINNIQIVRSQEMLSQKNSEMKVLLQ